MEVRSTNPIENEQSVTDPSKGVERHSVYFWDLVSFTVENQLFRVPKHPFVLGSPTFAKSHGPLSESDCASLDSVAFPGADKDAPIILEGVTAAEFEVFLQLMFPQSGLQPEELTTTELSKIGWLVVLKLSTAWKFIHYRKMAIDKLNTHISDPIELVKLAREYSIVKWLASGYKILIKRKDAMTEQAGDELGVRVAFKLCLLREEYATSKAAASASAKSTDIWGSSTTAHHPSAQMGIESRIQAAFKEELGEISRLEMMFRTKEEREADEAVRQQEEAREQEARVMKDEALRKEMIRTEVEEAKAKLAAAEEAHHHKKSR